MPTLQATKQGLSNLHERRVGLIAAWGDYPVVVAKALARQGYRTFCLGVAGHADENRLTQICDDYQTVGVAKLGGAIRYFRRNSVTQATMAGKFHKRLMFQKWVWLKNLPDWTAIRHFFPPFVIRRKNRNDDSLLGVLVAAFAKNGITLGPATDYAPELLVKLGQLTRNGLSKSQLKDIEFGWQLAKEMGRLDIGQSVAVKNRAVLAVEAIEGTDQCIRRAGALCESGGFTVVKVAKPQQDMRFDVPTIGVGTLESLVEAGGRVLAVEADKTIIVDRSSVVEFADRYNLVIVALESPVALEAAA